MNRIQRVILAGVVIAAALTFAACNAVENKTQSASLLTVMSILGVDAAGQPADYLQSDVVNMSTGSPVYHSDVAAATIRNSTLDPNPINGVSQYNDVILTRYVVTFSKPNGASVQGVDVPYSFEGTLSTAIPIGTQATFSFVIVRDVAKTEPPLIELANALNALQTTARIDFYGHDVSMKDVKATGYLTVYFANYADVGSGAAASRFIIR